MTTVPSTAPHPAATTAGPEDEAHRADTAYKALLERAATPYYLLLGASVLLLVLGVVMVFSASSVTAFAFLGSSLAIVLGIDDRRGHLIAVEIGEA